MSGTTRASVSRIRLLAVQSGPRQKHTDAEVIAMALNPAARLVAAECLSPADFSELELTAGESTYDVPGELAPFVRLASARVSGSSTPLELRMYEEIVRVTGSGEPRFIALIGEKLVFKPTPAVSATVLFDAYGCPAPCAEENPARATDELNLNPLALDAVEHVAARKLCVVTGSRSRAKELDDMTAPIIAALKRRLSPGDESIDLRQDGAVRNLFM